jgi:hypothetical protein
MFRAHLRRLAANLLVLATVITLAGCWTAPVATVEPKGPKGLIQEGIRVRSADVPVVVHSITPDGRVLSLLVAGETIPVEFRPQVTDTKVTHAKAGDLGVAVLDRELAIYALPNNAAQSAVPAGTATPEAITPGARVLTVDPSYRLVRLQYPDGRDEELKVHRGVELKRMEAGDSVVLRTVAVLELRMRKSAKS